MTPRVVHCILMPQANSSPGSLSRRNFLSLTSAASAVILAGPLSSRASAATEAKIPNVSPKRLKKHPIGLELYSVRSALGKDLPGTLKEVAGMGYEAVEFYSPYCDWTMPYAKDVRSQMDDLGLRCYSTHNRFDSFVPGEGMAKAIELNQILGSRQLVVASTPKGTTGLDGWKKLCERLSSAVAQLQPHGLTAGFHNHQTEWAAIDGSQRIMDVVAENTPHEFVLQLDVGTCMEAGADPIAWIKAHPGRIRSIHLKDWAPGSVAEEKGYRVLFGEGVSPWSEIIAAAEAVGGVEFYLLEQEGSRFSEFETAQRCLENWKKFRQEA